MKHFRLRAHPCLGLFLLGLASIATASTTACAPSGCRSPLDCQVGEYCDDRSCRSLTCHGDEECDADQICEASRCIRAVSCSTGCPDVRGCYSYPPICDVLPQRCGARGYCVTDDGHCDASRPCAIGECVEERCIAP